MRIRRVLSAALVLALAAGVFSIGWSDAEASSASAAANRADFDPGNLISDAEFFDGEAMSAAEVRTFLNSQVKTCRSGYVCLKDFTMQTPTRAAVSGACSAYTGKASETAAEIVTRVGNACGISQRALLVMLEKEQGLVRDTWPGTRQYRSAMGYGCPDTADCDSQYYGFFNQVYSAALQFKYYAANPQRWNHVAGKVNAVRFHPNAACGSSAVFIQNQATAGLYNYTPYQPNSAALANLYGTGDSCSAYGNRNFWRMYTDWFGSPTAGTSLLRTNSNPTVYLVTGGSKHAVPSMAVLNSYLVLGSVGFVSDSYLARFSEGVNAKQVVRDPSNTLYFVGAGYKLRLPSCELVADYGGACNAAGYIQLEQAQIDRFRTGPQATSVLGTQEGPRYLVKGGAKSEILDQQSQDSAGIPAGMNVLSEAAIAAFPLASPVIRDDVFIQERGASRWEYLNGAKRYTVATAALPLVGLPSSSVGSLSGASIAKIAGTGFYFSGVVTAPSTSTAQVLTSRSSSLGWSYQPTSGSIPPVPVSDKFLSNYKNGGTVAVGSFVKAADRPTVYMAAAGGLRAIDTWSTFLSFAGASGVISDVPAHIISALPQGGALLQPGMLVRSAENPTVYLINGAGEKVPLTSFDPAQAMGLTELKWVGKAVLDGYKTAAQPLGFVVQCGSDRYLAAGGSLHLIAPALQAHYPQAVNVLDGLTCKRLVVSMPVTKFIQGENGALYLIDGGARKYIATMARYAELGGSPGGFVRVANSFLSVLRDGGAA